MFRNLAKAAAWASVGFIVYATLVPLGMRPTLGELSFKYVNYERFAAYAVAAAFLVLAYPHHPVRLGLLVIAIVVVLELAQLAIPDRDARVVDTLVKVAGGLAGTVAAGFWNRRVFGQRLPPAKMPAS